MKFKLFSGVALFVASSFWSLSWLQSSRVIPITVDTVAELATLSLVPADVFDERVIRVNDRGGFFVRYDKDSSATVDDGFVFAATAGRFLAVDQTIANIVQFGAIAGDGISDTAAIQAAINSGAPVFVPKGSFNSATSLALLDNTVIYGLGTDSKITSLSSQNILVGNTDDNVRIEKIHLVGFGADVAGDISQEGGIYLQTCRNTVVAGCEFDGFSEFATQIRSCKNTRFTHNYCHDFSINASAGASTEFMCWGQNVGIVVSDNVLTSDVSQDIYVGALAGDRAAVIANNLCDTLDSSGNPVATPAKKRHGIITNYQATELAAQAEVISGNVIRNTGWTGIYVNGSGEFGGNTINITGNVVQKSGINGVNGGALPGGIRVNGGSSKFIIQGNIIEDHQADTTNTNGSLVLSTSSEQSRMLVANNQIVGGENCSGIVVSIATGHLHLIGNSILFPGVHGITVGNGATPVKGHGDCLITGNRIEMRKFPNGTYMFGIDINHPNPENWRIANNVIACQAIYDGAFDASVGPLPDDALTDQIIIVATGGTIGSLIMAPGDWVQALTDNSSSDANWAIITHEDNGVLADDKCVGIHPRTEAVDLMITGNNIRGFSSGIYWFTTFANSRILDPPRIYDNLVHDCHGGVVVRGGGALTLVPVSPTNRIVDTESTFGDSGGYTAAAVFAEIRRNGLITFDTSAIPAADARYVKGDIANNSDYDDLEASSWHYDGTAWQPLIP